MSFLFEFMEFRTGEQSFVAWLTDREHSAGYHSSAQRFKVTYWRLSLIVAHYLIKYFECKIYVS